MMKEFSNEGKILKTKEITHNFNIKNPSNFTEIIGKFVETSNNKARNAYCLQNDLLYFRVFDNFNPFL